MPSPFPYAERAQAAETARQVLQASHRTWRQDRSDASHRDWMEKVARFRACLDRAYPPAFWESLAQSRSGDGVSVDVLIDFLEADPFFFRSGYAKSKVVRAIKRVGLTRKQIRRLQAVLLRALEQPTRRGFRDFCRLAPSIGDDRFHAQILCLTHSRDAETAQRANWMIAAVSKTLRAGGDGLASKAGP